MDTLASFRIPLMTASGDVSMTSGLSLSSKSFRARARVRVGARARAEQWAPIDPLGLTGDALSLQDSPGLAEVEGAVFDDDEQHVAQALLAIEGHLDGLLQGGVGQG